MNAIDDLIAHAERLTPSGVIGDGMVAHFHILAERARLELGLPTCDLCAGKCRGHRMGHPKDWEPEPGSRDADAKLIADLIATAWKWGHGCSIDDISDRETIGDSYNEGCRDDTNKAGQALAAVLDERSTRIAVLIASRKRTRDALEAMRERQS